MLLSVAPAGAVQDPRDRDLEIVQIDTSSYPEVTATVSAPSALSAQTLTDDAFRVTEGSKSLPVTAEAVDVDTLEVILAVDPGTDTTGLRAVQGAALELISLTMPRLPMTVIAAGASPKVTMARSRDAGGATESIEALEPATEERGDTLDALSLALDQVGATSSAGTVVVLIAASATGSAADAGDLADRVEKAQIPLEIILPGEREAMSAYASLDDLPSGNVIAAPATEDVVGALDRVTTDLTGRYRLRFRLSDPAPADPQPLIVGVDADGIVAELRVSLDSVGPGPVTTQEPTPVTASVPASAGGDDGDGVSLWLVAAAIATVLILILAAWFGGVRALIAARAGRRRPRAGPPSR
ncbi:MAG: hypothetical protein WKF43_00125 [Acidimicrobiales bacterium]